MFGCLIFFPEPQSLRLFFLLCFVNALLVLQNVCNVMLSVDSTKKNTIEKSTATQKKTIALYSELYGVQLKISENVKET